VDVGRQDYQVIIQNQHRRTPSARQLCDGPFADPSLPDQLLYDLRDSAALQSRRARKIRPGNWLTRMYQLQNDLSIDRARRFAGGRLDRIGVDAPHSFRGLPGILQSVSPYLSANQTLCL
jgi:hypothetical protein